MRRGRSDVGELESRKQSALNSGGRDILRIPFRKELVLSARLVKGQEWRFQLRPGGLGLRSEGSV